MRGLQGFEADLTHKVSVWVTLRVWLVVFVQLASILGFSCSGSCCLPPCIVGRG
jgi:hypothetical protein